MFPEWMQQITDYQFIIYPAAVRTINRIHFLVIKIRQIVIVIVLRQAINGYFI